MTCAETTTNNEFVIMRPYLIQDISKLDEKEDIDFIEHFRTFCSIMYEERTVVTYVNNIQHFSNFIDFSKINKSWDYQRFRPYLMDFFLDCKAKGLLPQTIGNKLSSIDRFFVFLKDRGIVSENPIEEFRQVHLKPYKYVAEHHQIVSKEKMEEIIKIGTIQKKHWRTDEVCLYKTLLLRTLLILMAQSMPRRQAICNLDIEDIR